MAKIDYRKLTKEELLSIYNSNMNYYKTHNIKRPFGRYAELFFILFNDGTNPYMWSLETICSWFPECDRNAYKRITIKRKDKAMDITIFALTAVVFYALGVAAGRHNDNFKE